MILIWLTDLQPHEVLLGIFVTMFFGVCILTGSFFIKNYFKTKKIENISLGIGYFSLSSMFWGSFFNFWSVVFFKKFISEELYVLLGNFLLPFVLITFMVAYTRLIYLKHDWEIIITTIILCLPFTILTVAFSILDSSVIASRSAGFSMSMTTPFFIYLAIIMSIWLVINADFARHLFKIQSKLVRIQASFLLVALVLNSIAFIIDIQNVVVSSSCIMVASLFFYWGFFPPKWLERACDKKKKKKSDEN